MTGSGFITSFTGPVREQPHLATPPRKVRGGDPGVLAQECSSPVKGSAPGGAAPFAATREQVVKPLVAKQSRVV